MIGRLRLAFPLVLTSACPVPSLQWWRRQLGVVSQEPGLLTGSIADIISYGQPGASDSEVEWAARAAQAHDFICELPQGYQVRCGACGRGSVGVMAVHSNVHPTAVLLMPTAWVQP